MTTPCKTSPMLSAYADGQLSEKDRNRVAHHLEVCDLCRKEFAAIQLLGRLLCAGEELTPSLGFAAGFWRKVDDMEKIKAGGSWFRWRDWGFGPAWAAAAATIVLVFGVLLYRQTPYRSLENVGETPGLLIAEDIELYEDFEIIQHLDLLEQWKTLSSMEDI